MRKKILCTLFSLACCFAVFSGGALAADTPKLYSDSACVIDADSGEILYQKHGDRRERPASITKQMTALIVLEKAEQGKLSLDDKVKVTAKALSTVDLESTRIGFEPGEKRTLADLMSCMLVYSANDAANIIAEYVGGSVEDFVKIMNNRAMELGCTNTHFSNPNGLDPDDDSIHLTTAHDMALISYELAKHPEYYDIAGQVRYTLDKDKVVGEGYTVGTKVDMLDPNSEWYSKEVSAGKTGWTSKAHHTMCVCVSRGDRNFVIVVMNSLEWTEKYKDTNALVDYCCDGFDKITLTERDYRALAEKSMAVIGAEGTLAEKDMPETVVYLPKGMTASDLRYRVVSADDENAKLQIGISENKWDEYHDKTHINGKTAIIRTLDLPLKKSIADKVSNAISSEKESGSVGSVAEITTPITKIVATVAAALLILASLIFLIFRTVKRKNEAKKKREEPHLTIVIKTPDKYKDRVESPDDNKK